ncbi:DUF427 domain-containing protein [Euzebya sp.]|uniref:DUF427 domain-containing protein n=1 Tax=Euzebya sp. TaxID=1971409 RepID=UPI003518156A
MDAPEWLRATRDRWTNRGQARPTFADEPGPGQESVWDYPRPPIVVPEPRLVEVVDGADGLVARSTRAVRVLETASPPTVYVPPDDVVDGALEPVDGSSLCEWKGQASYLALSGTDHPVAWCYPTPFDGYVELAGWVAFYPGRVACTLDGERVRPQPGGFYGGWVTDEVVGPFKGDPGTSGW